jgi:succinoglycan biosynthesis protein ExoW
VQQIAVIIPFFQREPGILARALNSISRQHIPDGWSVEVIVVDDGSPRPAQDEVRDLRFTQPLRLKVIRQENAGVAAARNRGLEETDASTTLIAFLDSDDSWPERHIANAIEAWERGFEFIFSDNRRELHHDSHIDTCARTKAVLNQSANERGIVDLPPGQMPDLVIDEFPTQASTVVYQRSIAPDLRFNTDLTASGEDVLFMLMLAASATKVGFISRSTVLCGRGVNMYFGNFAWDSPIFMTIKHDQVRCHTLIAQLPGLPQHTLACNARWLRKKRDDFVFHTIRRTFKGKLPDETRRLAKADPGFLVWFPWSLLRVAVGYALGSYRP